MIKSIFDKYVEWRSSKVSNGFRLLCEKLADGEVKWRGKECGGGWGYIGGTKFNLRLDSVGYHYNLHIGGSHVKMSSDEKWLFKKSLAAYYKREQEKYDKQVSDSNASHRRKIDDALALIEVDNGR